MRSAGADPVSKPYKLVSRDVKAENTVITFAGTDATFGARAWLSSPAPAPLKIASRPCGCRKSIPAGAQFFRGGAYKRAPHPIPFRAGRTRLQIMAEVRDKFGMKIVTEAIDGESLTWWKSTPT